MTAADGTPLWANAAFLKLAGAANDARPAFHRAALLRQPGRLGGGLPAGGRGRAGPPRDRRDPHARRHRRAGERRALVPRARQPGRRQRSAHVGWLIADITREREHQENIFQELQNAIDYLDHAPAGFFSLEPDGRIRYLNATLAEWIGIDLAEFEPGAAHIRDIVTRRGAFRHPGGQTRRAPRPKTLDLDLVRTDGTRLPVRLLHRVPVAPDGTVGASRTLVLDMRLGDEPRGRPHRRDALRPLLQQHADGDRLGRPARAASRSPTRASSCCSASKGAAGGRLAELVQESDRAGVAAAIDAAIARPERHPRGRRRASPTQPERSVRFFVSPILEGR